MADRTQSSIEIAAEPGDVLDVIADFERYVDSSFQTSVYQIFPLTPTESAWEDDQTYVCLAYEEGEELTGSIEGDGR